MKRLILLFCLYLSSIILSGIILYQSDQRTLEMIQPYTHDYALTVPEETVFLDINQASAENLSQLPDVSRPLADQIVDYREKNGKFSEISELVACVPDRLLSEISILLSCETEPPTECTSETEISILLSCETEPPTECTSETEISITEPSESETIIEILEILFPLDLNQASVEELCAIPGIGIMTAESIIAYREEQGGFLNCQELLSISGIGEIKYSEILPYLYLETEYFPEPTEPPAIPVINLNTAIKEDLLRLPGCDDALAEEIIQLREEEIHIFHNILELTLAEHVTTDLYLSWESYLSVDDQGNTQIPYVRPSG